MWWFSLKRNMYKSIIIDNPILLNTWSEMFIGFIKELCSYV